MIEINDDTGVLTTEQKDCLKGLCATYLSSLGKSAINVEQAASLIGVNVESKPIANNNQRNVKGAELVAMNMLINAVPSINNYLTHIDRV